MLVLQTQANKTKEPEWITVMVDGRKFKVTAKIEPYKKMKNRVVIVFDAPRDIQCVRDSFMEKFDRDNGTEEEDNKGNK